jgi:hypothetical protein
LERHGSESLLNNRSYKISRDKAGAMFAKNQQLCLWVHGVLLPAGKKGEQKESRHLARVAVVLAMVVTYRVCQTAASDFWSKVRDGDCPARSPMFKLRDLLKSVALLSDGKNKQAKVMTTPVVLFAKCIHAWNAYRENRSTDLKYYPNSPLPKPV